MSDRVRGVDGMTVEELQSELWHGGRCVRYEFAVSVIVLSFRRFSSIYFIPPGASAVKPGLPWSLISLLFGWWGIPWGPIFTIMALVKNFRGGEDVTEEVMASLS